MAEYMCVYLKKTGQGRLTAGAVTKMLAEEIHRSGVPFYAFLSPYIDTVQLGEKNDTAKYVGAALLLKTSSKLDRVTNALNALHERLSACGLVGKGEDPAELYPFDVACGEDAAALADRYLTGIKTAREVSLACPEGMRLCRGSCRVEEVFFRGFTDLELREFSGSCLAYEEICDRMIRQRGGRVALCANLDFVFAAPEEMVAGIQEKMQAEFTDKIEKKYGKGFGGLRFYG